MSSIEVKVPNVGVEGEVEVVEVCVAPGDSVEVDSELIVLESDKATVEVPSPYSGTIESVSLKVGDKVREGSLVLVMSASETSEVADADVEKESEDLSPSESVLGEVSKESAETSRTVQLSVPDLGGSESVEVIEVLVQVGDQLEKDQAIIVLESDKATMEIPCSDEGVLRSLNIKVGDKVSEGDVVGDLEVKIEPHSDNVEEVSQTDSTPESSIELPQTEKQHQVAPVAPSSGGKVHAGPAVRKFAREHGVDLVRVSGSGPKGRILKEDLRSYIKSQVELAQNGGQTGGVGLPEVDLPDFSAFGDVEIQKMDRVQRLTAKNMQASWLTVPHVTQFDEADITELESFRKGHKAEAESRGVKLTPVAFIVKACAYALRSLPQFNVSLDMKNEQIVRKGYVHIGLAVDTPSGLVVPVIRDADKKSLWEIASDCQELASRAQARKLSPADMQGSCFTISSLGSVGGTAFTPIVNTPEVAILGVSRAQVKPIWDDKESFIPRLMLPLSLSYDHRAVNGADAARFTTLLCRVLGDLRELLL